MANDIEIVKDFAEHGVMSPERRDALRHVASEVKRLKEELADADACIQSHDPLRGKVVDLQRERDEARRRVVSLENSCREYLADLAYRQREQEKVERERDEALSRAKKYAARADKVEARIKAAVKEQKQATRVAMKTSVSLGARIEAALDIKPFPRWGDSGHPVVWHDDLVKALTGGRE